MATLKLEIVTPEEKIYSEDVEMVTLPGSEGELGVYPKHVPLLTTLVPGELRVLKNGRETAMAIGEGFVEIKADAVSVLTDMALESEKIDIATAEAAVERAKAAMKEDQTARTGGCHSSVAAKSACPVARQTPPPPRVNEGRSFRAKSRNPVALSFGLQRGILRLRFAPLRMTSPDILGIIAGNGVYPRLLADGARRAGVEKIVAAAFTDETDPVLERHVNVLEWMRVGQLGRLLKFFRSQDIHHAIMAGQIAPKNLFDLRPDLKALMLLGKLKERNAESIFAAIADELAKVEVDLLPATTFLEDSLARPGLIAGPKLSPRQEHDVELGWNAAKEIARLDIGQTIIIKNGTIVAVEALEGTNEAIKRGGTLAREGAVMVKVSKPNQDMRFDVPVIGVETVRIAAESGVRVIAVEAGKTLLLERDAVIALANGSNMSVVAR